MAMHTLARAATLSSAVLALASAPLAVVHAAVPYSAVYAFGDSLTDTGNLLSTTEAVFGVGNGSPQRTDYWEGRFSNGPVAVEVVASKLNVPLVNFAFGGATSGTGPTYNYLAPGGVPASFSTGLQAQLGLFNTASGGVADPNGLYFVWAGANDLRGALTTLNPVTIGATVQSVYTNLGSAVGQLYASGARNFLLPLLPDLGLTPEGLAAQALVPPQVFSFSTFSVSFNNGLLATYDSLRPILPGATLTTFDTLAAQRAVAANPAAYGITDVTTPCFSGYVNVAGAQCAAGFDTTNMYWDRVHPSAITHAVLGQQMAAAVPEPQTMLMMAVGVAALLGLGRRRQRRAA